MLFFADRFPDLQRRYSQYLHLLILLNMMQSTVSFQDSGEFWLIPSSVFANDTVNMHLSRVEIPSDPQLPAKWLAVCLPVRLPVFLKQLFGEYSHNALSNEMENARKKSNEFMRERVVRGCASKLALCTRDFEESLFALHQEVDHLGPDNDANSDTNWR